MISFDLLHLPFIEFETDRAWYQERVATILKKIARARLRVTHYERHLEVANSKLDTFILASPPESEVERDRVAAKKAETELAVAVAQTYLDKAKAELTKEKAELAKEKAELAMKEAEQQLDDAQAQVKASKAKLDKTS